MKKEVNYDIPASLIEAYREYKIVVRFPDPSEITKIFYDTVPEGLAYVRILSLEGRMEDLKGWCPGIPIDLVVRDVWEDLPRLYRYAPLLATHPLRVTVPLVSGFEAVAKVASSLNFAVKVEGGQPDPALTGELLEMARIYLYRTTVSEPIDFFHSLFRAFYQPEPVTLWVIQEEEPALFRTISDGGEERLPGRLAGLEIRDGFSSFTRNWLDALLAQKGECAGCDFLINCAGYFKWPREAYDCQGIRAVMGTLRKAARELRREVDSLPAQGEREAS